MKKTIQKTLLLGYLTWACYAYAAEVNLDVAKSLVDSGKSAEAYALLAPAEFEMSGNEQFDYLLAIAALDSGKPEKAILAFDRVLSSNPNFAGARMDLGRAYFALKSNSAAREQFELVLQANPPAAAKETAEKYLAAIDAASIVKMHDFTAYAEFSAGHDSNVNASTSQANIYVPAFGSTLTLASSNLETASNYFSAATGGEYAYQIRPTIKLFIGADLKKRNNPDASMFHMGNIDAHAGARFGEDENNFTVAVQRGRFYLGGKPNRDSTGANGQWSYTINPLNQISLFGAHMQNRYVETLSQPNDTNLTLAGIGWLHAMDADGKTLLSTTAFAGYEAEHNSRADGNKDLRGMRVALQHSLNADLAVYGNLGLQYGSYDTYNVAFSKTRADWQYDASLGLNWQVAGNWSVRPQLTYSKNDSNITINEYNRTDASITARWDFR